MKGTEDRRSLSRGLRNRIRIPYRMLDKRFNNTSRLMVSSKVWQKTIPTNNCDVLLTFPAKTEDSTLMWLLARLKWRVPEVVVNVRHHSSSGIYGFYMTASYENLLKGADDLAIQKPLKSEYGGGLKEFTFEDQECFAGVEDEKTFLTSQERQSIVYYMINNLRAEEGEELGKIKFLEGQPIVPLLESKRIISQVFPLHNSTDLDVLNKTWVQAFDKTQPLDFVERVGLLEDSICEYFGVKIAMYFAYLGHYTISLVFPTVLGILLWILQGNQAFDDFSFVLFAIVNVMWATLFLEHWKRTSAELAYKWGTLDKKDELLEDPRPLFKGDVVKNPVTDQTCFEYPAWKRNLFRYFVTVPVIFICLLVVFVVMLLIFQLQEWINGLVSNGRIPGFIKFLPKIMLALSIGVLDDIYKKIAYWLNQQENYRLDTTYETSLIIKLVLFQFVNSFLSLFYIAFYLQDMSRLRDQLAAIFITRQIVGNLKEVFMPYFIWKFRLFKVGYKMAGEMSPGSIAREFKEMTEPTKEKVEADSPLLAQKSEKVESPVRAKTPERAGSGTPFSSDIDEPKIFWPLDKLEHNVTVSSGYGSSHSDDMTSSTEPVTSSEHTTSSASVTPMTSSSSDATTTELRSETVEEKHQGPVLTQAEVESVMKPYTDTWEDYMEMVIQFGYVTLFSSAFPLAALCAFINNIIEIRSDAFKLCFNHQRPFGKRVGSIGIWQDVMEAMGVIAVIVNCALVGTSGIVPRVAPDMSSSTTILLIIVIEHIILLLKFILAYAIPDVPEWVATEKAKLEFKRRVALKRLESQGGRSPDVKSKTTLKTDSVVNTMSSHNHNNRDDRSGTAMTDDEIRERQMQNRNLINASHASPNNMERIVSRTTERSSSRRLSETSSEGQRVLGRRYTDPRNNTIYNHHRHEQKRENSRNTSPMHTYSFDDRYDRVFGHDYQYRDTSPAPSTKSSSRSPIKQLLLDEYIASYNSPVSHDRSQIPSNKYLDSHLRKRNLSPIKVSSNPGTWRSSRSPSPGNKSRSRTPGSRPMSPIAHDSTPSPSPSPTSYKISAPFATGISSPTMPRRRKDIIKQQSPPKDLSKNFAAIEKQQQYMSRNVSDCLRMDSRIPVAEHRPAVSAPFALSLD